MSAKETKKLDWMEVGQQKAVALSVKAEAKTWMANTIGKQDQVETKKMPSTANGNGRRNQDRSRRCCRIVLEHAINAVGALRRNASR